MAEKEKQAIPGSTNTLSDFNSTTKLTSDDDYNPFEHREVAKPNSTTGSLVHLLKSSLGTGILAMPMAFKNAGLLFGGLGTIIVGLICTHCVHILVKTSHDICKKTKIPLLGFAETAERVIEYGPPKLRKYSGFAKTSVDYALIATYYGTCSVFIVFIAASIRNVINFELGLDWSMRYYICIAVIPVLILGQIRVLKYLVPFSAMANIFILITFGITLYYLFNAPLKLEDKPLFASWGTLPLFFSTVIFAMEGIGLVMPVENEMKNPQKFLGCPGVLNTAMGTIIVSYLVLGFFGYARFGNAVLGSVTLNLPEEELSFVDYSLVATYYGANCVYIVFIGASIKDVINYEFGIAWDIRVYIAMSLIPVLMVGQIRELKYLVPFSALANLFIVITFSITLYYMFNVPLDFSDKPLFRSWGTLPLFFSTVIFAMEGIGVVMPVENQMKKPEQFLGCPGVLNSAMATVIILYTVIGFFGYVRFGENVLGSVTLNLPEGILIAQIAQILIALAILFTFGLQYYVPNDIIWRRIQHRFPKEKHNITQICIRSGVILIMGAVAAAVPDLEPFIGLVGAVFFSTLGLLVPCVVEAIYLYPNNYGPLKWKLYKNIFLSVFAIFALIAGSTVSIGHIIDIYK